MNIGILGTGHIGQALHELFVAAGHRVQLGSRFPDAGQVTIKEAISESDIIFVAVPYGVWPTLAPQIADDLKGKIQVDAGNPNPGRDGAFAIAAMQNPLGPGAPVAELLPGVRLVRAFSTMVSPRLVRFANREAPNYAMPVAGDDPDAVKVVSALIRDVGFVPIETGNLASARLFAPGTDIFGGDMTAQQARDSMQLDG
ncbi:MAG: NAD(P)-binding domain-containing protein [Devosiaceae bacterium]|nr:NAD(P)-binding domain-containing protein [Devosiaceae bacterium MH13]